MGNGIWNGGLRNIQKMYTRKDIIGPPPMSSGRGREIMGRWMIFIRIFPTRVPFFPWYGKPERAVLWCRGFPQDFGGKTARPSSTRPAPIKPCTTGEHLPAIFWKKMAYASPTPPLLRWMGPGAWPCLRYPFPTFPPRFPYAARKKSTRWLEKWCYISCALDLLLPGRVW